ncbi:immunity protein YezG family protein [Peribacillus loiseleuriae]|uniref:immunity protein YezG family protein n=1 Tax=Peribacillus loiseleuriae TaxID=1679170 RepID=UPI00381E4252
MKVLEVGLLHSGIDEILDKIGTQKEQVNQIKEAVTNLIALEDSLKGAGGNAIRGFYEKCHKPFLLFYENFLVEYEQTLNTIKSSLTGLEPSNNGFIRQSFLEHELNLPWLKIYLYAEVSEDSRQVFFYFYTLDKSVPVYSLDIVKKYNLEEQDLEELEDELYECFTELWEEFGNQNQEKWTNLTFAIDNTGNFNIDYYYDDLSEVDSYEQQIIWEYKIMGLLTEGDRPKAIIEKYISEKQ